MVVTGDPTPGRPAAGHALGPARRGRHARRRRRRRASCASPRPTSCAIRWWRASCAPMRRATGARRGRAGASGWTSRQTERPCRDGRRSRSRFGTRDADSIRIDGSRSRRIAVPIDAPGWRDALPRPAAWARRAARAALTAPGRSPHGSGRRPPELTIVLADDRLLRRLNRRYRGKDKPTNVLSSPIWTGRRRAPRRRAAARRSAMSCWPCETIAARGAGPGQDAGRPCRASGGAWRAASAGLRPRDATAEARRMESARSRRSWPCRHRAIPADRLLAARRTADTSTVATGPAMSETVARTAPAAMARRRADLPGADAAGCRPAPRTQRRGRAARDHRGADRGGRGGAPTTRRSPPTSAACCSTSSSCATCTANDVMVPRADIVARAGRRSACATLVAMLIAQGHSRLPVYRETLDDVIGIVHIKDLLACVGPAAGPSLLEALAAQGPVRRAVDARCSTCCCRCACRASTWPSWSTSSAASTGWSPSRIWSRRSSARSRTSMTSPRGRS